MEGKRFAFLAHRVEIWNYLLPMKNDRRFLCRWFKGLKNLHCAPEYASDWKWLYPYCVLMSVFFLLGRKAYDIVDRFGFSNLSGTTCLLRNFGWHFFIPFKKIQRRLIKKRILRAVLDLQDSVDVIGLGALAKAQWLTQGGEWIVKELGDKLKVPLVHGDTLTAETVVQNVLRTKLRTPVIISGATSKIGRAVALSLARRDYKVYMYTQDQERFLKIYEEAGAYKENIFWLRDLAEAKNCLLWITGKAVPAGKKLLKYVPEGATVINFSVPDPISEELKKEYQDRVDFIEGGLLYCDKRHTSYFGPDNGLSFTMRLRPDARYACQVGTMVHAHEGWTHHEVGKVELDQMPVVWLLSRRLGFYLKPR